MTLSRYLRDQMRGGRTALDSAARKSLRRFVLSRQAPGGRFWGPGAEQEDIYYSFFGSILLSVLGRGRAFLKLRTFAKSARKNMARMAAMDLPHAAALAAVLRMTCVRPAELVLDSFRATDGGFSHLPGRQEQGTGYGAYLALLLAESANLPFPHVAVSASLSGRAAQQKLSTELAASLMLARFGACTWDRAGEPFVDQARARLLGNFCSQGGVRPCPEAEADLLSTATALAALAATGGIPRDACAGMADFVASCWTDCGGFGAAPGQGIPDVEYTAYALLALGSLSSGP